MRGTLLRSLVAACAIVGVGAITTACGNDGDPTDVTVQHMQFDSFDPHFTASANEISILRMVFRGLYEFDRANQVQPELADSMPKISDDGLTYTVDLKRGLQWSDGDDLTSEDVVAGILRTCDPRVTGLYSASLFNIEGCQDLYMSKETSESAIEALQEKVGVKALGPATIEFKLLQPQATFINQLALWYSFPMPIHKVDIGEEWPENPAELAYSGPFKTGNYQQGESLTLLRNEYFGADGGKLANLESVTLRFIEDTQTAMNAFQAGNVLAARADPTQLKSLRETFGDELVAGDETTATLGLQMMANESPLNNQKLRLALSQASNRDEINSLVYQDGSVPTTTWIPGHLIGVDEDVFEDEIGFDPEKAQRSFRESGAPVGLKLTLLVRSGSADIRAMGEYLQQQWKEILGIDLELRAVEGQEYRRAINENDFQIILSGWAQDYADAENWVDGLFNSEGPNNHFGCERKDIDDLLAKAKATTEKGERVKIYRELNEKISAEICGMAPLVHNRTFFLIDSSLKGAKENASGQDFFLVGDAAVEEWYRSE